MQPDAASEVILIRHAPALTGGRLCGRSDVGACCDDISAIQTLRAVIGSAGLRLISPALRCRQTAAALWPDMPEAEADPALQEQDFGAWEGMALTDLPDLGALSPDALASHRPPDGESFSDLCDRATPALMSAAARAAGGRVAIVAHAGTIRAALALALGMQGPALAFEIAPLSLTRIVALPGGAWSVRATNWTPA